MSLPKIQLTQTIGNGAGKLTPEEHMLLASERRYLLCDILREGSEPFDLEGLATALASRETGLDPNDPEALRLVRANLHHTHLPKMADVGVIEYDPHAHVVYPVELPR